MLAFIEACLQTANPGQDYLQIKRLTLQKTLHHTSCGILSPRWPYKKAAVKKIRGHDRLSTTEIHLNLTDSHVVEEFQNKW